MHALSICSPSRKSTPSSAARPDATIIAVGVARPSAQGQTITSIEQRQYIALLMLPGSRQKYHSAKTPSEIIATAGINIPAILSARRSIGDFEHCARSTTSIICSSTESLPIPLTDINTLPERFSVPEYSMSPIVFSTGTLSPVSMDSSTVQLPSITLPSTLIRSPGRTRIMSCCVISEISVSFSSAPRTTSAVFGRSRTRRRIALPASLREMVSRYFPKRINESSTHSERK